MKFSYKARTQEGDTQSGFIEASSREGALDILKGYGLYTTVLLPTTKAFWQKKIAFLEKTSKKDIASFTYQLSILLNSNISLLDSLQILAKQIKKEDFKEKLSEISEDIEGGSSFSQALSRFPKLFSPFYVGMLRSGETSGKISETLDYIADYLEKEQNLTSQLIGALVYPAFVLLVFIAIFMLMGTLVVPSFEAIFSDSDMELPWTTKLILLGSQVIRQWWWIALLSLLCAGGLLIFFIKQGEVKKSLDRFLLKVPVIGEFIKKFYLSRIALNLSTLISGGVSISKAFEVTSDLVGNDVYRKAMLDVRKGVRDGKTISSVFSLYPDIFPPLVIQTIIVGEETGRLEKVFQNIVSFYEKEVSKTVDMFIKLIEPIMILVLGGLTAGLALGLFVPLFQQGMNF